MSDELNPTQVPISENNPDLDDILGSEDFGLDDDGEIQMGDMTPQESTPAVTADPPASDDAPPAPEHNWEERYKNLEPEFTRRSQRLAELEKQVLPGMQSQLDQLTGRLDQLGGGEQPADGEGQIEIPENLGDILNQDPAQGAAIIAEISDRVVERRLIPILERVAPMVEDWELESELRTAATREGREDFFELLPAIRDVITRSEKDLSFDDAYNIVKTFQNVDGKAAAPGPVTQTAEPTAPSTERVSPEEARQLASRIKPDTSVSGEVQPEQRVADSVEDAFSMAVEEHYGE
jgi:hypothetical protein